MDATQLQLLPLYLPIISASQLVIIHSEHAGTVSIQNNIYILSLTIILLVLIGAFYSQKTSLGIMGVLWSAVNIAIMTYHLKITRNYINKPDNNVLTLYQDQDKTETLRLFVTNLVINLLFIYILIMKEDTPSN